MKRKDMGVVLDRIANDPSLLGWVAGMIDGEGSILIARQLPKARGRRGPKSNTTPMYYLVLKVGNTHLGAIQKLREFFGGRLYEYKKFSNSGGRSRFRFWEWRVTSWQAAEVLRLVRPHLVIKREEAEIALALQGAIDRFHPCGVPGISGRRPNPPDEIARRESLYQEIRAVRPAMREALN